MECVIPAEVDRVMGGKTINLSVSAQTAYDAGQLLGAALKTGKPKHIIMNLDYNAFSGAPDRSGFTEPFPRYMYDDALWNDLPYLLGVGTLRKSLETTLGLRCRGSTPIRSACGTGRRTHSSSRPRPCRASIPPT